MGTDKNIKLRIVTDIKIRGKKKMKFLLILLFCGVVIDLCAGRDGHHGHAHGHHGHDHGHHGHDHGHHHGHGHDHGHHHGHGHDHGHHDDVDEHGHYHDESRAAKFRYSKQANKVVEPVKQEEPRHKEEAPPPPKEETPPPVKEDPIEDPIEAPDHH